MLRTSLMVGAGWEMAFGRGSSGRLLYAGKEGEGCRKEFVMSSPGLFSYSRQDGDGREMILPGWADSRGGGGF